MRVERRSTGRPGAAPWFAALEMSAGALTETHLRRWISHRLRQARVPWRRRAAVRQVGAELTRQAAVGAGNDDIVRLELDFVGSVLLLACTGPADGGRLDPRAVAALRVAGDWGTEQISTRGRRVWCHLEIG